MITGITAAANKISITKFTFLFILSHIPRVYYNKYTYFSIYLNYLITASLKYPVGRNSIGTQPSTASQATSE